MIGVALTEPSSDEEQIEFYKQHTENITRDFLNIYQDAIAAWNGDVSVFQNFDQHLQSYHRHGIEAAPTCKGCIVSCVRQFLPAS